MIDPKLREKLTELVDKYNEVDQKIADPDVIAGDPAYTDYLREHGSLAKDIAPFKKLLALEEEQQENNEALNDPELKELAIAEAKRIESEIEEISHSITETLSGDSKDDSKNVMLEIRAGTGGDEAAIFAGDLLRMYQHYADKKGWKTELVSSNSSEAGGFKEVVVGVQGENVFKELKYEGGGHRVQRVPETESQGRIHTSAATVVVLPEAEEYEVDISPNDLEIQICRSSGPGGQSVNTTDSAVRIIHIPTGIQVFMQDEKSQHKNKAKGMRVLRSRIYDHYQSQIDAERADARRSQTGSGDRSERVRTYNFPQNRLTDHRLGRNFSLDRVVEGDMDKLLTELIEWGKQQELAAQ
ncbi:MAG: peptide chain release factor 1 [Planctomycetota bacterium]|jgi:peptide chain release factor 1